MTQVRSWVLRALPLPMLVSLGLTGPGCKNDVDSTTTSNTGASGAEGGGGSGTGAFGGGGNGGSICTPEKEICDKKDNDCDGEIDDVEDLPFGCECFKGDEQPCYTGPDGTIGVGVCAGGVQACDDGTWGECTGQIVPTDETCNLADDDCDGIVDDMGTAGCGTGACAVTVDKCINGQLQICAPGQPSVEVCDGVDNDCDQEIDEGDPKLGADCASSQLGACKPGIWECIDQALVCTPNATPSPEVCDGIDSDCDGTTDNNIPGTGGVCFLGLPGVCDTAIISCKPVDGVYQIDCFPTIDPGPELCDNLDNDCNGDTDEDDPEGGAPCDTGQPGVCGIGTMHCVNGALACVANQGPSPEACNGLDDNCDGTADEGDPGTGEPCGCGGTGIGLCQNGELLCMDTGGGPTVYFQEDFSDNSAGWTLGPTWQIGPAVAGCLDDCEGNPDPGVDHTPTADNGIAGVIIGGPAPTNLHGFYWLESPPFNTENAAGSVYLTFWRWLNSDYLNYMQNKVQVFNGTTWVDLPYGTTGECCPGVMDDQWTNHGVPPGAPLQATSSEEYPTQFDLTPYKNATMRIRFGYRIGDTGVYTIGSWNLDDVIVASTICD